MKLWKLFCVLAASKGQIGPYGPVGYVPGPYRPRGGQMPMAGYGGHQVHPQQMGQGHQSDQNHGHGQVAPAQQYVPGQKSVFVRENNAMRKASINENIHQGALCGKTLNFSLAPGDKGRSLKSPKYPAGFSSQTQCVWQITSPPGTRIRVDFEIFNIFATGRACSTVYLEFSSLTMDSLGNEIPDLGGSFKICGKNPGYIISQTNQMTVWLHADEAGMGVDQKFLLKLSATREAPRVLAVNGAAVSDGRPKGSLAKKEQMSYSPAAGSIRKTSSGPINPPGSTRGGTVRSPSQVGTFNDYEANVDVGTEMEQTDNRIKNMGIMFLFIGVAVSLIAGAVLIRRRIEKSNASEEEQKQSSEVTKDQK